jgi:hypothetical protein
MSKIKSKISVQLEGNIGNNGWIEIGKVTIFIGNQGSEKVLLQSLFLHLHG